MFWTRLASGIVLVIVAFLTIMAGGNIWFLVVSLLSLIGLYELYKTMRIERTLPGWIGCITTTLYCILLHEKAGGNFTGDPFMAVIAGFLVICAVYVFTFPKFKADQIAFSVFGLIYVPVLMMHLYQIRELPDGLFLLYF